MAGKPQNFDNHVRLHPIYHFVLVPIFLLNVAFSAVDLTRRPGWFTLWTLIMSIALLMLMGLLRAYPLKVQDRVICLEERLRLATLLPENLRPHISELTEQQLIALRFASDHELPALTQKTLAEHLRLQEIKQSITDWRADRWRV